MEQGKTIKQLAEEIGVSKQAIRDRIEKFGLQSSLKRNGNHMLVCKEEETLIKASFVRNGSKSKNGKQNEKKRKDYEKQDALTLQLIEMLKEELQMKNKQIEDLSERLAQAHTMAQQAQQLHGADKALKIQENEHKKLMGDQKDKKKWQFWK